MYLSGRRIGTVLLLLTFIAGGVLYSVPTQAADEATPERSIAIEVFRDKIKGGWAGQMIGVTYGTPTEFKAMGEIIEGEIPWDPKIVYLALRQDDLYVETTFIDVLDEHGLDATIDQYGEAFRDTTYHVWHANAAARRNLALGIPASESGLPKNNLHSNDIDFQIEADFIGLMCPGLPADSNEFCNRIGRIMNYGDGLYGGMFVAAMYSAAFFESDPVKLVEAGLASIPDESRYEKTVRTLLNAYKDDPSDWKKGWKIVTTEWDKEDDCPAGAASNFNIDASLNGAYVALGLLYGQGDFKKTIDIATRAGQDSDCNPATAAGVLGVVMGYEKLPEDWKVGIPETLDQKFIFTEHTPNAIMASNFERAIKIVERAGGRIENETLYIPHQEPTVPELEQSDVGRAVKVIDVRAPEWKWDQNWKPQMNSQHRVMGVSATVIGATVELEFEGTGIVLIGRLSENGGRADVFLDGEKMDYAEAWTPLRTHHTGLWSDIHLKPGKHTIKIVQRGDGHEKSTGREIMLVEAVIYDN